MDAPGTLVLEARSSGSTTSAECSTPTHRNEHEDSEAVTQMLNKLMHERNDDTRLGAPLLAAHDQEDLDVMAKEEAKVEAERIEEEERLEHEREVRELRALALCSTAIESSLGRSKPKGILGRIGVGGFFRMMKSPVRIFRAGKKYEYSDVRAAEVIVPRASLFGACQTAPSSGTRDSQLAMMRNAAQPRMTRQPLVIQFETVGSTQRDVPAWTREEYLRRNGRIPQNSTPKEDEELGGIEGNNLMNQYYVDGVVTDYDSDSD